MYLKLGPISGQGAEILLYIGWLLFLLESGLDCFHWMEEEVSCGCESGILGFFMGPLQFLMMIQSVGLISEK